MRVVTYLGPYGALEIDDLRLVRNGEPVLISEGQIRRLRKMPKCDIEVSRPVRAEAEAEQVQEVNDGD